jgi:hypothetical protein
VASASNISIAHGQAVITLSVPTTVPPGQNTNLVVDFDLGGFTLQNGDVVPDVRLASAPEFLTRSRTVRIPGTVSNLASDSSSFTLTTQHGATFTVQAPSTASTVNALWSPASDAGAPAILANGDIVAVKGTLDPVSRTITATEIFVHTDSFLTNHGFLSGTIASLDSAHKSFTLTVEQAVHIQPSGGTMTIQTDQSTIIHNGFGTQPNLTFGNLSAGQEVDVLGVFDTNTNSVLARRVDILPSDQ